MKSYSLLGVRVDSPSMKEVLDLVCETVKNNKKIQIATVNNEFIVDAQKNKHFLKTLNNAHLNTADSTGVLWAINKLYGEKIERVPGSDMTLEICKVAPQNDLRIFLLGGLKGVANNTKNILIKRFPGIHIVGTLDGIEVSEGSTSNEIISAINQSKPSVVFVALGAPKQEIWISQNMKYLKANVFVGVGGTFDYISGRIRRAPQFMRELGLEWLFRLIMEPRRFKRIFKATVVFPWLISKNSKKQA